MKSLAAIIMFGASLILWQTAHATEWSIKGENSQIGFEASAGGTATRGGFGRYKAEIDFDEKSPTEAKIHVLFDMHSVSTGTPDVDGTLQSADFFDVAKFPMAEFRAQGAQSQGGGKFVLSGQLTLKGVTKPVSVPFTIQVKNGLATVTGEATINRKDFGVGPDLVSGIPVDNDVKITINLQALRLDN